jgi:hypothetical protein
MRARTEDPWLPHIVLLGIVAVCALTDTLILAPFFVTGAALVLRSRMLLFAGLGLILVFLAYLVLAGGIGGSVEGGVVE